MSWRIRHEGSPRAVEGLTLAQVSQGLLDGQWEPSDEVMGPGDRQWVAIENHPQLADLAMDLEPPPPSYHPDETTLDMNPLIDVCLVLLIFFILTTTYAALQKVLDMPGTTAKDVDQKLRVVTEQQVNDLMIRVTARLQNGQPVIRVENRDVDADNLVGELQQFVKDKRKTMMLLDAAGVDWGTVVKIQDAAKGAKINKIHFLVRSDELTAAPKQ